MSPPPDGAPTGGPRLNARTATRLLTLAALVGGIAALTAGWLAFGGDSPDRARQRYVEGVVGSPDRVNPLLAGANRVDADLAALIFSGLTRLDGDGAPLPDLAERWEITPDGRTYTFHLRRDVFWHDGERFDAGDVAFTIGLLQDPDFTGTPDLAARWAIVQLLPVDEQTLILRLPEASASLLTQTAIGILPEHLLAGAGAATLADAGFNRAPVGTGPYRLVRLDRDRARLERHTGYHLGIPQLEQLELRFHPDGAALTSAIEDGAVDGALIDIAGPIGETHRLLPLTEAGYLVLYINNRRAPLDDAGLRRALVSAVDPAEAPLAAGAGLPGEGPIVPGSWAYTPLRLPNPVAAGALFDAAGWPRDDDGRRSSEGVPLALEIATGDDPRRVALARLAAEQLRARGVSVELVVLPAERLFRERLEPRDFELLLFGWQQGADPDPYSAWHTSQIAAGQNVAGFNDPASDRLLEAARATVDVAERLELYARFGERFVLAAPSLVLLYPQRLYALPRDLRGVDRGLLFTPASRFRDIHLWRFDP